MKILVLLIFITSTAHASLINFTKDVKVSILNDTNVPLAASAVWTGSWESDNHKQSIQFGALTDQEGQLCADFRKATRGNAEVSSLCFDVGTFNEFHTLGLAGREWRLRFTNTSAVDQTSLEVYAAVGNFGVGTAPANLSLGQDSDASVVRVISEELDISRGKRAGNLLIHKFGNNSDVDAAEDIWEGGANYTGFPASTIEAVEVLSASANDTSAGTGCRTIRVFGLDATKMLQEETVTLNGTTPVDTANTYTRVYRATCLTAGTTLTNAGIITLRHTTTVANVFAAIPAGRGQTAIAIYTVPAGYTGMVLKYGGNMRDTNTNRGGVALIVHEEGGAQRRLREFNVSTADQFQANPFGGLSFPAKTDIKCRALNVNNANANINCFFDILLVKN